MDHCAGAHGARFNGYKQFAVHEAVVVDVRSGTAKGNDLGVSCGIGISENAIPTSANDLVLEDDYRADRDFVGLQSTLRTAEGLFHPELVGTWLGVRGFLAAGHRHIIVVAGRSE